MQQVHANVVIKQGEEHNNNNNNNNNNSSSTSSATFEAESARLISICCKRINHLTRN